MHYLTFPATGDKISVLGFGAMGMAGWFGAIDDGDAIRALHTALDLGVNMIDTARAYERSEEVVGKALAAGREASRSWRRRSSRSAQAISSPSHRHDMVISLVESGLIDSVQTIVNVFASEPLDVLVPICQQHDVAVIARCILDEGGLTGFLTEDTKFAEGDFRHGYFDWTVPRRAYLAKVNALRPYVPEHASSLSALAVKFAAHHPGVTTAITSMHVEEYARMNIAAVAEEPLSGELMHQLRTSHRFVSNLSHSHHWPIAAEEAPCWQTGSVWDLSPDSTRPVSIPRSKPKES